MSNALCRRRRSLRSWSCIERASTSRQSCATGGYRSSAAFAMTFNRSARAVATLGRDDAELARLPADRVRRRSALTHQAIAGTSADVQASLSDPSSLIGTNRVDGRVAASQIAGRIVRIVLAALKIGLHIASAASASPYRRTLGSSGPPGRAETDRLRLTRHGDSADDHASSDTCRATDAPAHGRCATAIDPMHLKSTNCAISRPIMLNLAHGRLPSMSVPLHATTLWHSLMPHSGAVHVPQRTFCDVRGMSVTSPKAVYSTVRENRALKSGGNRIWGCVAFPH